MKATLPPRRPADKVPHERYDIRGMARARRGAGMPLGPGARMSFSRFLLGREPRYKARLRGRLTVASSLLGRRSLLVEGGCDPGAGAAPGPVPPGTLT